MVFFGPCRLAGEKAMPGPQSPNTVVGTSGDDLLDISGNTADYKVDGRAGNDTIVGGEGHDSLLGGRGDDLIYASADDSSVDGGTGADTVSFLYSATGVTVGLSDGALGPRPDTDPSTFSLRVLSSVENVTGSIYNDLINGSRAVNHLDGGAGNDDLFAYGSGDFLTGGPGADLFQVSQVVDSVRRGTETVTLTDFNFSEGDRIDAGSATPAQLDWVFGTAPDAEGNLQPASIGTWDLPSGGTFELIVLGTDTPSTDWFIIGV
jgi:Ca2+-binding RTX toxin-like protein